MLCGFKSTKLRQLRKEAQYGWSGLMILSALYCICVVCSCYRRSLMKTRGWKSSRQNIGSKNWGLWIKMLSTYQPSVLLKHNYSWCCPMQLNGRGQAAINKMNTLQLLTKLVNITRFIILISYIHILYKRMRPGQNSNILLTRLCRSDCLS